MKEISRSHYKQLNHTRPVECPLMKAEITSLSEYLNVMQLLTPSAEAGMWFRGQGDIKWELMPTALRYKKKAQRETALNLVDKFRRIAEFRIDRPPKHHELSRWTQLAQHYGLPTRLLDWTTDATVALFFCCQHDGSDGVIYLMNPTNINYNNLQIKEARLADSDHDSALVCEYLSMGAHLTKAGTKTAIAIHPFHNSERIMLQRGCFTLHGNKPNDITVKTAPSLVGIPILEQHKKKIITQLRSIGTDEMSIFPEAEHICNHLKYVSEL